MGALAIAGSPPFCIFDSEWMIFAGAFQTPYMVLSVLTLLGSLLTVAYALWFVGRIFIGRPSDNAPRPSQQSELPSDRATDEDWDGDQPATPTLPAARLPLAMLIPTVVLAFLALIEGLFPAPVFNWVAHELPLLLGGNW